MRVLLDENLNHRLRHHLFPHDAFTVHYMGWSGLKNGQLLRAAENAGFDVLLTGDQTLSAEQNIAQCKVAVVVITAIEWPLVKNCLREIVTALSAARVGTVSVVECSPAESSAF